MRKGTLSSLVVIGALGATALMLSAQVQRSRESVRIPVINQAPQSNPEGPEPNPPPPPPELSAEAKQSILKSIGPLSGPGSLYARVSPPNSFVASKASLAFNLVFLLDATGAGWYAF